MKLSNISALPLSILGALALAFTVGCGGSATAQDEDVAEAQQAIGGASNEGTAEASCKAKGWYWNPSATNGSCAPLYCVDAGGSWDLTTQLCASFCDVPGKPVAGFECSKSSVSAAQEQCETKHDGTWNPVTQVCSVSCLGGKPAPAGCVCAQVPSQSSSGGNAGAGLTLPCQATDSCGGDENPSTLNNGTPGGSVDPTDGDNSDGTDPTGFVGTTGCMTPDDPGCGH